MGIVGDTIEASCTNVNAPYDMVQYCMDVVRAVDADDIAQLQALLQRPEEFWLHVSTHRKAWPFLKRRLSERTQTLLAETLAERAQIGDLNEFEEQRDKSASAK